MIVHTIDDVLALFDRLIEDRRRAFVTTTLLHADALDDDVGETIDAALALNDKELAQWRVEMRAELEALSLTFPQRLTWTPRPRTP